MSNKTYPEANNLYPTTEQMGCLYGIGSSNRWRILTTNVDRCISESSPLNKAIPDPVPDNLRVIPVPGGDNTYWIKTIPGEDGNDGLYLYVADYLENTVSFVETLPPSTGNNGGVFQFALKDNNSHYKIRLDISASNQYLMVADEMDGENSFIKARSDNHRGKTQKWVFVASGIRGSTF